MNPLIFKWIKKVAEHNLYSSDDPIPICLSKKSCEWSRPYNIMVDNLRVMIGRFSWFFSPSVQHSY